MTDSRPGDLLAPDGIIIRPIAGAGSPLVSVVVGVILPRDEDYPVHLHYALEQVTYVLSGRLTALTRGQGDSAVTETALGAGDAIATPPATTLSFRNRGPEAADVLFICVPPYPPSNADTELVAEGHRPLSDRELGRAIRRQRHAQEYLHAVLDARRRDLGWFTAAEDD